MTKLSSLGRVLMLKDFLNESADEIVLDQSERVPLSVQNLSNVILSRIKTRKEKNYLAKKRKRR